MSDPGKESTDAPEAEDEQKAAEKGISSVVKKTGRCECEITVDADEEYMQRHYEEEVATLLKEVSLPGFRQGKVPRALLEQKLGERVKSDVLSAVVAESYDQAVKENDLKVVAQVEAPEVDQIEWDVGQPLALQFKCEVLPEVDLQEKDYRNLEVEIPALEATDRMVEEELDKTLQRMARWEKVETRGIDREDYVECELRLLRPDTVGGRPWKRKPAFFPRDKKIGPFAVEGTEGALLGLKAGEEAELEAQCPDEAAEEELAPIRGQTVSVGVKVLNVYRRKVPELTEELAESLGFSSADELRVEVRERVGKAVESTKRTVAEQQLLDKILQSVDFEMPQSLVNDAAQEQQRRTVIRQMESGVSREEVEENLGQIASRSFDVAERGLKVTYLLKLIAEKERIYVSESEVQEQIRLLASRRGWTEQRARRYLEDQGLLRSLRGEMRESRTKQFLMQEAKRVEIDPELFAKRFAPTGSEARQADDPAE